ncbi:MAG: hypothetical protein ACLFSQ_11250, partial [Candidatus Zixiibacteriota bacterium]
RMVVGAGDPNEKVTVEGAISIQEQDLPPSASTNFGKIFIDNSDNHLYYIDEVGDITDLTVDGNAVQSVSSSANINGRVDHMRFIPGEATEITESATDDTIYIRYDITSDGSGTCTSPPPTPSFIDGNALACSGEPGTAYSTYPIDGARYYRWTLPSGSSILTGSGTNSIQVLFGNTDGDVCVSSINDCGESSPFCMSVTINRPTTPGSISGDALVCSGETGINYFIATVPDADNYIWTLPAGAVLASGTGSPSITVNFADIAGDICVQTENSCGISSPVCMPVSITDIPETPGTISGPTDVCSGETDVTYSISAVDEATDYTWTVPSGATIATGDGTRTITVDFGSSSGDISVTASSICGTSSPRTLAVAVNSIPSTPGTISGASEVTIDAEDESYSISPVTDATSYLWTVTGDASIDGSATGTSIDVDFGSSSGTTVDICVNASNTCGTSSDRCLTVTIEDPYLYSFTSHTFTNCGETGAQGPLLSDCVSSSHYGTTGWVSDISFFNIETSERGIQKWTAPETGNYEIIARGAEGGRNTSHSHDGGDGAIITGTFSLTEGEILHILVGQKGQDASQQACGGGGTFVAKSDGTLLIAAGGGGGGSEDDCIPMYVDANTGPDGKDVPQHGGGTTSGGTGGAGGDYDPTDYSYLGGGAGFSGNGNSSYSYYGKSFLNGGEGAMAPSLEGGFGGGSCGGGDGGGGAGGYSGGAGGAGGGSPDGPGGGGGSYNTGSSTSATVGNEGHGSVDIQKL